MFHIHSTPISSLLCSLFSQLRDKHITLDDLNFTTDILSEDYPLVLYPRSLGLLTYIGLTDTLITKGTKYRTVSLSHDDKTLFTSRLSDEYLYPYYLVLSRKKFVSVLWTAYQSLPGSDNKPASVRFSCHDIEVMHNYLYGVNHATNENKSSDLENDESDMTLRVSYKDDVWSCRGVNRGICSSKNRIPGPSLSSLASYVDLSEKEIHSLHPSSINRDKSVLTLDRLPCFSFFPFDINRSIDQSLNLAWKISSDYPDSLIEKHYQEEMRHYCYSRNTLFAKYSKFLVNENQGYLSGLRSILGQHYFDRTQHQDEFHALLSSIVTYESGIAFFGQDTFNFRDIDWFRTFLYGSALLMLFFKGRLQKKFTDHAMQSLWGISQKSGKHSHRSHLIYTHYRRIKQGLGIGSQIPPTYLVMKHNEPRKHIYELLDNGRLTLLWFVGEYSNHDDHMTKIFIKLKKRLSMQCDAYLVTNQYDIQQYDDKLFVLGDYHAHVHQLFGCPVSMLYLIRPDGYVIWRGVQKDQSLLEDFLSHIHDLTLPTDHENT